MLPCAAFASFFSLSFHSLAQTRSSSRDAKQDRRIAYLPPPAECSPGRVQRLSSFLFVILVQFQALMSRRTSRMMMNLRISKNILRREASAQTLREPPEDTAELVCTKADTSRSHSPPSWWELWRAVSVCHTMRQIWQRLPWFRATRLFNTSPPSQRDTRLWGFALGLVDVVYYNTEM